MLFGCFKAPLVLTRKEDFADCTLTWTKWGIQLESIHSVYSLSPLSPSLSLSFPLGWLFRGWFVATPDTLVRPRPYSHTQGETQHTCAYTCIHIARRLCRTQGLIIHVISTPYHKESATGIGRIFHSGSINAIQLQLLLITDHLL